MTDSTELGRGKGRADSPGGQGASTDGTTTLLDRAMPADYVEEWTRRVSAERADAEPCTASSMVFRIGAEWLALPTRVVCEVAEPSGFHGLPHRRDGAVRGIVAVRGELMPCVSLSGMLNLELPDSADRGGQVSSRLVIVLNVDCRRIAFPVDEVAGIYRYDPGDLAEVPTTLAKAAGSCTLGVLRRQNKAIACLDDGLLLSGLNKNLS